VAGVIIKKQTEKINIFKMEGMKGTPPPPLLLVMTLEWTDGRKEKDANDCVQTVGAAMMSVRG